MVKVNTGKGIVIPDGEATVLSQMCQVVIDRLNERGLAIQPGSRFSQELDEIEIQERREWLGEYISSSSTALLLSVIEMVVAHIRTRPFDKLGLRLDLRLASQSLLGVS